ncbi:type I restriction enzyme HsdR N-terminal domain-containing protein [Chryseobacterium polytrichastri]|uniref:Type I restriction enzyme R protein N terminus (HSDR_N) n=1 Tax=Chryseobacterium polytrichastri TaxID=1302687 RepID=A0A1M7IV75_9FLAO|nr:type I restriction enzyme HsdR N-terminal domain-containing protein [Chryseobacterium polytrichastri]SHM44595.1 Type I restriction enzyme R protein N terminus (HSDR_N) [Chryseobacterium polytrichastri]
MELPKLNFQETFDFKFKKDKDKFFIYDVVRKTYLLLTPEEWVRQHWIHYYLTVRSYSVSALITEKKIILNGLTKRIDLLVTEKAQPKILIECKAPSIKLTEKTFEQTARYNSIIGATEIVLTNGLQHINAYYENGEYQFYKA